MISLKSKEKGFTIVELLIVIVVIGILAALVVTTFSGIQKKGRDSERKTDIGAVHSQLEAYHATNGRYPTLANLQSTVPNTGWVAQNLKGLSADALSDPKNPTQAIQNAVAANQYAYEVSPLGCDNDPITATADCATYTLTASLEEGTGATFVKTSLN